MARNGLGSRLNFLLLMNPPLTPRAATKTVWHRSACKEDYRTVCISSRTTVTSSTSSPRVGFSIGGGRPLTTSPAIRIHSWQRSAPSESGEPFSHYECNPGQVGSRSRGSARSRSANTKLNPILLRKMRKRPEELEEEIARCERKIRCQQLELANVKSVTGQSVGPALSTTTAPPERDDKTGANRLTLHERSHSKNPKILSFDWTQHSTSRLRSKTSSEAVSAISVPPCYKGSHDFSWLFRASPPQQKKIGAAQRFVGKNSGITRDAIFSRRKPASSTGMHVAAHAPPGVAASAPFTKKKSIADDAAPHTSSRATSQGAIVHVERRRREAILADRRSAPRRRSARSSAWPRRHRNRQSCRLPALAAQQSALSSTTIAPMGNFSPENHGRRPAPARFARCMYSLSVTSAACLEKSIIPPSSPSCIPSFKRRMRTVAK